MSKKWIKQAALPATHSWQDIADMAEVSRTTVWRWRNGHKVRASDRIARIVAHVTRNFTTTN